MTPRILPLRERAAIVNSVLAERFKRLLPKVMRETGFDMWLIICNEDNLDPVFPTMIPWGEWTPILQILVIYDRGDEIELLNISRTRMIEMVSNVWRPDEEDQWDCLRRIVSERNPRKIGVNHSDVIWAADGLTFSLRRKLIETLGPELSAKIEPAEQLCIRWLETLLPEEIVLYEQCVAIAHSILRECLSRRAITPGATTVEDLRWYYWQRVNDLGLDVAFTPTFRVIRSPESRHIWGNDPTIREGDLVHSDVGIEYLRLLTDHQEMAYVLKLGETDAPKGLQDGIAQTNRLQDIFISEWKRGRTGNEILKSALTKARESGIEHPRIYSHSLGHYLHEPGPLMGLPWEQECCPGRGDVVMEYNTCYTVELSSACRVPEWGNEYVRFMLEQDVVFTENGVFFLDGRQTSLHLI